MNKLTCIFFFLLFLVSKTTIVPFDSAKRTIPLNFSKPVYESLLKSFKEAKPNNLGLMSVQLSGDLLTNQLQSDVIVALHLSRQRTGVISVTKNSKQVKGNVLHQLTTSFTTELSVDDSIYTIENVFIGRVEQIFSDGNISLVSGSTITYQGLYLSIPHK